MAHIARLAQCESAKGAAPAHISGDVMAEATPKAAGGAVRAFDARARKQFLDHLAMTANVAASSRKAGVTSQTAYAYRRRHPEFAALWQAALSEGFGKLEQDLLAEALTAVSGKISDATLKGRAQKHRLALALLSHHRATVRGLPKPLPVPEAEPGLAEKVAAKIRDMHARMLARDAAATLPE